MTFDSETAYEFWNLFRSYIPAKEKLAAAERLVEMCDEYGFARDNFAELADTDKILEEAVFRYFKDVYEDEEEDY